MPRAASSRVEDTIELLAFGTEHKGLELIRDVAPGLAGLLIGDPSRLRRILLN